MSFVDFGKELNVSGLGNLVVHAFDELMVLYRLVGVRQDIDICIDNNNSAPVCFNILAQNQEEAIKIFNEFNGTTMNVYGSDYEIHMVVHDSTVNTIIKKLPEEQQSRRGIEYYTIF